MNAAGSYPEKKKEIEELIKVNCNWWEVYLY
jgi:hypothetical protein